MHLLGDLPAVVDAVKALCVSGAQSTAASELTLTLAPHCRGPAVVVPLKLGLAFPIVYHTLGGFRHLVRSVAAGEEALSKLSAD